MKIERRINIGRVDINQDAMFMRSVGLPPSIIKMAEELFLEGAKQVSVDEISTIPEPKSCGYHVSSNSEYGL